MSRGPFDPAAHRLEEGLQQRAAVLARELAAEHDLAARVEPYAPHCWSGEGPRAPSLCLDDFSTLPALDGVLGVEAYQHRARMRAGAGDLFAAVLEPTPGYLDYCRDVLRLGAPEFVLAETVGGPMEVARACGRGAAFARLVAVARAAGGLVVDPFMGIEPVWGLAAELAGGAGVEVRVLGPPPPVTWVANDKSLLVEIVARLLGRDWLVETRESADPGTLARHVAELGARHDRVALKRLRCVSGMGNRIFEAAALREAGPEALAREVREFLAETDWDGVEGVLAVEWVEAEVSPSTQLWIPPPGSGPPRLDGIYEQVLEGEHGYFVGSRPSTLPDAVDRRIGGAALAVAAVLQALGYVGRCSFDHLLVGEPDEGPEIKFVDCNGRWGGTSLPMLLVERTVGAPRPPYLCRDFVHPGLVGARFPELLAAVGDELFDPKTRKGRYLLYNVGPLEEFGKLDVVALGETQEEADAALAEDLPRLLGLG